MTDLLELLRQQDIEKQVEIEEPVQGTPVQRQPRRNGKTARAESHLSEILDRKVWAPIVSLRNNGQDYPLQAIFAINSRLVTRINYIGETAVHEATSKALQNAAFFESISSLKLSRYIENVGIDKVLLHAASQISFFENIALALAKRQKMNAPDGAQQGPQGQQDPGLQQDQATMQRNAPTANVQAMVVPDNGEVGTAAENRNLQYVSPAAKMFSQQLLVPLQGLEQRILKLSSVDELRELLALSAVIGVMEDGQKTRNAMAYFNDPDVPVKGALANAFFYAKGNMPFGRVRKLVRVQSKFNAALQEAKGIIDNLTGNMLSQGTLEQYHNANIFLAKEISRRIVDSLEIHSGITHKFISEKDVSSGMYELMKRQLTRSISFAPQVLLRPEQQERGMRMVEGRVVPMRPRRGFRLGDYEGAYTRNIALGTVGTVTSDKGETTFQRTDEGGKYALEESKVRIVREEKGAVVTVAGKIVKDMAFEPIRALKKGDRVLLVDCENYAEYIGGIEVRTGAVYRSCREGIYRPSDDHFNIKAYAPGEFMSLKPRDSLGRDVTTVTIDKINGRFDVGAPVMLVSDNRYYAASKGSRGYITQVYVGADRTGQVNVTWHHVSHDGRTTEGNRTTGIPGFSERVKIEDLSLLKLEFLGTRMDAVRETKMQEYKLGQKVRISPESEFRDQSKQVGVVKGINPFRGVSLPYIVEFPHGIINQYGDADLVPEHPVQKKREPKLQNEKKGGGKARDDALLQFRTEREAIQGKLEGIILDVENTFGTPVKMMRTAIAPMVDAYSKCGISEGVAVIDILKSLLGPFNMSVSDYIYLSPEMSSLKETAFGFDLTMRAARIRDEIERKLDVTIPMEYEVGYGMDHTEEGKFIVIHSLQEYDKFLNDLRNQLTSAYRPADGYVMPNGKAVTIAAFSKGTYGWNYELEAAENKHCRVGKVVDVKDICVASGAQGNPIVYHVQSDEETLHLTQHELAPIALPYALADGKEAKRAAKALDECIYKIEKESPPAKKKAIELVRQMSAEFKAIGWQQVDINNFFINCAPYVLELGLF